MQNLNMAPLYYEGLQLGPEQLEVRQRLKMNLLQLAKGKERKELMEGDRERERGKIRKGERGDKGRGEGGRKGERGGRKGGGCMGGECGDREQLQVFDV